MGYCSEVGCVIKFDIVYLNEVKTSLEKMLLINEYKFSSFISNFNITINKNWFYLSYYNDCIKWNNNDNLELKEFIKKFEEFEPSYTFKRIGEDYSDFEEDDGGDDPPYDELQFCRKLEIIEGTYIIKFLQNENSEVRESIS